MSVVVFDFVVMFVDVQLLVADLAAMKVVAGAVAKYVGVVVTLLGRWVLLVVVAVAEIAVFLCHVHPHRLLRVGSLVVVEMVSRACMVICRGLCRCCLCPVLVVGRSRVG